MSINVEFTADEVVLVRNALQAFLSDFGREEKDVVHRIQDLLARLPQPV